MDFYDKLIKESIEEFAEDIPCPPGDEMFERIMKEVNKEQLPEKVVSTKGFKYKKHIAAAIVIFIFGSSLMLTTNQASAVKERFISLVTNDSEMNNKLTYKQRGEANTPPPPNINNTIVFHPDTFEQAQQLTEYNLVEPNYIPKGYDLTKLELIGDKEIYFTFIMFYRNEDKIIKFTQQYRETESAKKIHFSEDDTTIKKVNINDKKGNLIIFNKNKSASLIWQDHMFDYTLMCDDGEEETLKIAQALYERF